MSFGIYKSGQGYWVRVMTAAAIFALTVSTAAFAWSQAQRLADNLPQTRWRMIVPDATEVVGKEATLQTRDEAGEYITLATGLVSSYDDNQEMLLTGVRVTDGQTASEAEFLLISGTPPRFDLRDRPTGRPSIEPIYLQGTAAILMMIIGSFLGYYLVGVKKGTVEFLISTDLEMKKVNWSTKKDVIQSTNVVIVVTVVLTLALFGFDVLFQTIGRAINLLQ